MRKILGEKGSYEEKVPRRKILGEKGSQKRKVPRIKVLRRILG